MTIFPTSLIRDWFLREQRDLPWRKDRTPYRVWVSEIMLQQTQVAVVIDYFNRWMEEFPTLAALAEAPLSQVMKAWEGLGYYSRARNLHRGAQMIQERYQGRISPEILPEIPGLGPYTEGALLNFAFQQRAPAVDGNVMRVLTRYFLIEKDISKNSVKREIEEIVRDFLPQKEPWLITEGLIELGAQVCQKKPRCHLCPLSDSCFALMHGKSEALPYKEKKDKTVALMRWVSIIYYQDEVLVRQEKIGKVMGGLYEFPYFEKDEINPAKAIASELEISYTKKLSIVKHAFTRYRATLYPSLWKAIKKKAVQGFEWVKLEEIENYPFSAGHRKILQEILNENFTY